MNARDYYRKLNDYNKIKEHDGIPVWAPDDMIWFAEEYHKARLKECGVSDDYEIDLKGTGKDAFITIISTHCEKAPYVDIANAVDDIFKALRG